MTGREILIALHKVCNGDWDDMYFHIKHKTDMDFVSILKGVDTSKYVTLVDEDFPEHLKRTYRPPFVIERAKYHIK
jgi:hypothetical protein